MIQQKPSSPPTSQQGQALIEYVLSLLLVIGLFFVINNNILRGIGKMWKTMAREIAAGCPGCSYPDELK